jgi:hypothetical protein
MAEQATMVQLPGLAPSGSNSGEASAVADSLAQRVQRLEDAVAALQDTSLVEEQVLERVQGLLRHGVEQAAPAALPGIAQHIYDADRFTAPLPTAALPAESAFEGPPAAAPRRLLHRPWLLLDFFAELRAMVLMFFDMQYQTAWTTRLALLAIVPLIVLSHWWFPFAWVPFIGPVVDKLVDLALAFFLYKVLAREAHRYLETRARRLI